MLYDINCHVLFFFDTLLIWAQLGREIFLICDNVTKFWDDIDDQNFLLATVRNMCSTENFIDLALIFVAIFV
jgi:hypothetical protein